MNYGDGIVVPDEDIVATEAMVLMLVSFKGHWKCPIGYVLDDKLNSSDSHSLLCQALDMCSTNKIQVRSITMDGTSVNLSAMKLFGCRFGSTEDANTGTFSYSAYDYTLYFFADPPHMLKLARNVLGELKVFIDSEGGGGGELNGNSSSCSTRSRPNLG